MSTPPIGLSPFYWDSYSESAPPGEARVPSPAQKSFLDREGTELTWYLSTKHNSDSNQNEVDRYMRYTFSATVAQSSSRSPNNVEMVAQTPIK